MFQENSDTVSRWAEGAVNSVGLSERAYRELANVIGGQLTGAGLDIDAVTQSTGELVSIGADLAATFGGTTEEAVSALGATFRGEYDPAERFGLSLTAVRVQAKAVELGLADSTGAVTTQARAMATLALINEQTANAQGQFAREADTEAGARARAAAEAENQAAAFSDQLLPAYSSVLGVAGQLAGVFGALPGPLQTVVIALGGFAALKGPVGGALTGIGESARAMADRFRAAGGGAKGFAAAITPGAIGATVAVAGLALIAQELANNAREAAEAEARFQELTDAFADTGSVGIAETLLEQARRDFPELERIMGEAGVGFGELVAAYEEGGPQAEAVFERLRTQLGNISMDDLQLIAFLQQVPGAIAAADELAAAEAEIAENAAGGSVSLQDQVASLDAVADAADAARDALDSLNGIQMSLDEASVELQESLDATAAALAENGPGIDINTEAGRENLGVLRAQGTAIREYLISLAANGASAREVARAQDFLTTGLGNTARQAGATRGQTRTLIDTYARVPRRVLTEIDGDNSGARRAIDEATRWGEEFARRSFVAHVDIMRGGGFDTPGLGVESSIGPTYGAVTSGPTLTAIDAPPSVAPVAVSINVGTVVGDVEGFAREITYRVGQELGKAGF